MGYIILMSILIAVNAIFALLNYVDENYKMAMFHSFSLGFLVVALFYETAHYVSAL